MIYERTISSPANYVPINLDDIRWAFGGSYYAEPEEGAGSGIKLGARAVERSYGRGENVGFRLVLE